MALSFPKFGHPALGWVALVPLLMAISGWRGHAGRLSVPPPRRAFLLGLVSGLVYFSGTTYWTGAVVSTFGGLPAPVAVLAVALLAAYLALYPALTALIVRWSVERAGLAGLALAPFAWVATEYLRGTLFGGFPWVPLGNSQVALLPVAQVASVAGVWGLSGVVAAVSAALAYALHLDGVRRVRVLGATAACLTVLVAWGTWRVADGTWTREGPVVRVGLVQGNIAQADKWKASESRRIFTTHLAMTRDVVRRGAEFVIWPESSTPFMYEEDEPGRQAIVDVVRELRTPLLFGTEQLQRGARPRLYNAAYLIAPSGDTAAVYHKMRLVPFGEYVPMKQVLSFVSPLVERMLDFSAGESVTLLPVGGLPVSTAICYEVVYPWLAREAVAQGSQLLTTITNDGWYGQSSAPYQHFDMAAMRAIEQGRYLARAANTGVSGVIDPYGRVLARSAIFEEIGLVHPVRLLTRRTIYSQVGDVVPYASMAMLVLAAVLLRRAPRVR